MPTLSIDTIYEKSDSRTFKSIVDVYCLNPLLFWLSSCRNQPHRIYSRLKEVFWIRRHPKLERDSLLLNFKYGLVTKGYTRFWVQQVISRMSNTVRRDHPRFIANRTLFQDLRQNGFSDHEKLLQKEMAPAVANLQGGLF